MDLIHWSEFWGAAQFSKLAFTIGVILVPFLNLSGKMALKGIVPHIGYFAGIGLGFMLIEISQMQRLMIFLGHPIYGLSVVLFTLLLFSGVGSSTVSSSPADTRGRLLLKPLLLCIVLTAIGIATPMLTEQLKSYTTAVRIIASVVVLAPAGFFMGTMFPAGMQASHHYKALQPWFWGINGAASVFASILGIAVSMEYGINYAYWAGVACYGLCALLMYGNIKSIPVCDTQGK